MPLTSAARAHSPQPTMPSSVVSLTITSLTPPRLLSELVSACLSCVRRRLADPVARAAAIDERTRLGVPVGYPSDKGFELGDLHFEHSRGFNRGGPAGTPCSARRGKAGSS